MNGRSDLGCYMCEIFQFSFWRRPGRYLLGGGVISASVTKEGIKAEEVWLFELSCVFPYADYALSILGFHLWLVRSINISRISCETLQRDRRCKVTCQVSINISHKKWSNLNDPSQGDLELRGVWREIENRGWITRSHLLPGWSPVFDHVVLYVFITIRKCCPNQESQQSIYSVQRRPSRCMVLKVGMVGNLF